MVGPPEESQPHLVFARQREREALGLRLSTNAKRKPCCVQVSASDLSHSRDSCSAVQESQKDHTADRFVGISENLDDRLKNSTIGLVTLDDFKKAKDDIEEEQRKLVAQIRKDKSKVGPKSKKVNKKDKSKLSFDDEENAEASSSQGKRTREGSEGDDDTATKKRFAKDPTVDTSFLPDREREELEKIERERLRKEWLAQQEDVKAEVIEVTYSFWDGSGHRKTVECKKGDDIAAFLGKCRAQLPELRGTSVDNLMYIKEDLIIPHHYTFYDFIINKARGKSGPLFNFDVHDDVRMVSDANVEKDESHAGKVVERSWYNRFKHIFPASRWEVYDPDKNYGSYKIA